MNEKYVEMYGENTSIKKKLKYIWVPVFFFIGIS